MLKKSVVFTIGVIFVGAVASSFAKASDFYGGVGYGQHSVSLDELKFSGQTLAVFGGYEHNEYISFEVEHMIHGGGTDSHDDPWGDAWKVKGKGSDTVLWVVPSVSLSYNWSLYGKVGFGYYDYQLTKSRKAFDIGETQMTVVDIDERLKDSETGTSFYSGAGIKWEGENWGARLEFVNQENYGTEIMSLGLSYRF